jgi:hypothetical protein
VLGNLERLGDRRIADLAERALRNVLTDGRAELEALGISAAGDQDVRHRRMVIDDEIAARAQLVMAGMRLENRRVFQQGKTVRHESTRTFDPRGV